MTMAEEAVAAGVADAIGIIICVVSIGSPPFMVDLSKVHSDPVLCLSAMSSHPLTYF